MSAQPPASARSTENRRPGQTAAAAAAEPRPADRREPTALRATLVIAVAGALLFLLLLVAVGGGEGALAPLDREARLAGDDVASAGTREVAQTVTRVGSLPVVTLAVVVSAVALVIARRPTAALALIVGLVVVVVSVHLIKAGVGRARPPAGASLTTASFPSGHAGYSTAYTAIAAALADAHLVHRRSRRALVAGGVLLTLAVGLTRMVLGVHYLSDVVAGWALGAVVFGLAAAGIAAIGRMRHTEPGTAATSPPGTTTAP